jgi:hypothetical protein
MNQYVRLQHKQRTRQSRKRRSRTHTLTPLRTGQQEVQRKLQGHHRRRFPDQRGSRGRPPRDHAALGHRRPGALPVARCGFLPRRRLLRSRLRRQQLKILRHSRLMAGRVSDPGQSHGPGELPLRGARKQGRCGRQQEDDQFEAGTGVLPGEGRYSLL